MGRISEDTDAETSPLLDESITSTDSSQSSFCSKKLSIASAVIFSGAVFAVVVLTATLTTHPQTTTNQNVVLELDTDNRGLYSNAAVATDAAQCSTIGRDILAKNGSAVDAAIASMLCVGVHNAQSTGLAGSSFMLIYDRPRDGTEKELRALNFREVAPLSATYDMFINKPPDVDEAALEIAVFGEITGYWEAWSKYGRLQWSELFEPTIKLCDEGFIIEQALGEQLSSTSYRARAEQNEGNMRDLFMRDDGSWYGTGDILKRPKLAETLRRIAQGGAQEFYTGDLARDIIADLREIGSIISIDDLSNYKALWEEPMISELPNVGMMVATLGAPSGGPVLQMIMQLLDTYDWEGTDYTQQYHIVAEVFKFAYAMKTRLGDPRFVNITQPLKDIANPAFIRDTIARIDEIQTHDIDYYEPDIGFSTDGGTSHLSVYGPGGAAVALTSSVNGGFGCFRRGRRTGIIFNNGMDDFATSDQSNYWDLPPSYANIIQPGKRPLSSMSPTLVFDSSGDVVVTIGGAGGSRITTGIANALWHILYHGEDIDYALTTARLHHQLSPNTLRLEEHVSPGMVLSLQSKGHVVALSSELAVLQGIQLICDKSKDEQQCNLLAVSDLRKGGKPSGF